MLKDLEIEVTVGVMFMNLQLTCTRTSASYQGDFLRVQWEIVPLSSPFVHSHGRGGNCYKTQVQAAWDKDYLYLRFHCQDDEIVANMLRRDDPLYDEEVVEAFIAPTSLGQYFEFNLSPRNVVFDSLIQHDGTKATGYPNWDCSGLRHGVFRRNASSSQFGDWDGYLAISFQCLNITPSSGQVMRVNFFRIKRRGGDQYLAWSPTHAEPANFHIPHKFGELILA